jgi:tetratricopeptide (TPR) repeat protein
LQRYEEAVSAYQQAVKLNSDDTDMYFYLAETYQELERYEESIKTYQLTINLSKNYGSRIEKSPEFYKDKLNFYSAYHHLADLYRKLNRY